MAPKDGFQMWADKDLTAFFSVKLNYTPAL